MSLERPEDASALNDDERSRAARFVFERHRRRYIVAHTALRSILGAYTGRAPEKIELDASGHGKPFLRGEELQFNLSHSHEMAVFALSQHRVGIDIEHVRDLRDAHQIADRFFSPEEVAELRNAPRADALETFFRCWTRKEAFIKALGEGLSIPLRSFGVSLHRDEPALLRADDDPEARKRWRIANVEVAAGYVGAVAVEGGFEQLLVREWLGET
ncbi:MAG: 4'-phosphopantetheinyl transferase superfamily protein [Acidobacteriota bacterium]|nr:4'-phosphopantetheinyl transferase superfamily protein [Acidobacteriota bacterium]